MPSMGLPWTSGSLISRSLAMVGATSVFLTRPTFAPGLMPRPQATKTAFILGFEER